MSEVPFWQIASEQIGLVKNTTVLQIPLDRAWFVDGAERPTGILLRWEKATEAFVWSLSLKAQDPPEKGVQASATEGTKPSPDYFVIWIVTEPLAGLAPKRADRALTDIEGGRFQYDSDAAIPDAPTPVEPAVQSTP
jgi:hypothetical protein